MGMGDWGTTSQHQLSPHSTNWRERNKFSLPSARFQFNVFFLEIIPSFSLTSRQLFISASGRWFVLTYNSSLKNTKIAKS